MSNNVLNLIENKSNEDKKKVRRNKKEYYNDERENILQELKILMELDKDNSILLAKLRDNDKLKQKLTSILEDIKKYYRCSTWGYFVALNNSEKADEITLLRSIFKDHGYKIYSKDIITEYNGIKQRYTKIIFIFDM